MRIQVRESCSFSLIDCPSNSNFRKMRGQIHRVGEPTQFLLDSSTHYMQMERVETLIEIEIWHVSIMRTQHAKCKERERKRRA